MIPTPSPTRIAAMLQQPQAAFHGNPVDRVERLRAAVQCLQAEELDDAEQAFADFLHRHPNDAEGLHFQGILRHVQGRSSEALALLHQSLVLAPHDASHWNNYGNVLLEQQRIDDATQAYETSVRMAGDGPCATDALNNLCTVHRRGDRLADAERCARRAVELNPNMGDAWYNLSLVLMAQGRVQEGLRANSMAITRWPRHTQSRDQVIRALVLLGERDQAATLYREWLTEDPNNPVARHQLAACLGEQPPERASDAYVEHVFDAFATSFDAKLAALDYQAPSLLHDALQRHLQSVATPTLSVVDVGCGTGLMGPLLRPWASSLVGCDLSVGMLARAKQRGHYDVLHKAELTHYLRTQPKHFDLCVSADTLCYLGDLGPVHHAAAAALCAGGWLAYTVEAMAESAAALTGADGADGADGPPPTDSGWVLRSSGRYAHSGEQLDRWVREAGLEPVERRACTLRQEAGAPMRGWLVVARAPSKAGHS
jgi:predicted TPR repeat methyltransferase